MTLSTLRRVAIGTSAAFALAALGWVGWIGAVDAPARHARLEGLRAELRELGRLEEGLERFAPYWRALESTSGAPPAPADLWAAVAPGLPGPEVAASAEQPLRPPWRVRRQELSFAETATDALGAFLEACGTARPPWRASSLRLHALDAGATRARVWLALEAAARAPEGTTP